VIASVAPALRTKAPIGDGTSGSRTRSKMVYAVKALGSRSDQSGVPFPEVAADSKDIAVVKSAVMVASG
jgi:hypothetical protein